MGGLARFAVRRHPPRRRRPAVRPRLDLLEPWEQEAGEEAVRAHVLPGVGGLPYRPRRFEEVPAGASAALREAVGAAGPRDLFVAPAQSRPGRLGRQGLQILTPVRVLGFGPGGVALWVGAPAEPGVRAVLRPQRVAVIETAQILLQARLTILAADLRLNLHYSAVGEQALRPLVASLRRRAADLGMSLPAASISGVGLPYKWRRLLAADLALLSDGDPVAAVAGALPVPRRTEAAYAVVALTPRELVVRTDPVSGHAAGGRHGVHTYFVPRARIERVRADGPLGLRIRVGGADLRLPLGEDLSARVVDAFAQHLPVVP
jgi:hypothetical protein